jgi:hypothetical protein
MGSQGDEIELLLRPNGSNQVVAEAAGGLRLPPLGKSNSRVLLTKLLTNRFIRPEAWVNAHAPFHVHFPRTGTVDCRWHGSGYGA